MKDLIMSKDHIHILSRKLSFQYSQVNNTVRLLKEGATIPFISRYRKELTGNLDEKQIFNIRESLNKLEELDKRREFILTTIEEQGKLTDELKQKILEAETIIQLEDIYLPFKSKRKTRSGIAREKGLEPLAKIIFNQQEKDIEKRAGEYFNEKVVSIDDALQGARDIIAEWINEDEKVRNAIRTLFDKKALIYARIIKGKEEEGVKYRDYFNYTEKFDKSPSHRVLAVLRANREGILKVSLMPEEDEAIGLIESMVIIKPGEQASRQLKVAIKDTYKRLLFPSIENEYINIVREKADEDAIEVFVKNLQQLLLEPPLGPKRILAIDPGFKSGCKLVCLDEQGNLLHNQTIYPHPPRSESALSGKQVKTLVNQFKIDAIAIGGGTAGRETEAFIKKIRFDRDVKAYVVNEDGASVYSASDIAREEFPQYDVTVRGTVSIGRRLMDPLSELVKIDPKSVGVGQYQHDVDQTKLKISLDQVVINCVNLVGVDLNTASKYLLTYISGLGPQLAQNIVDFRKENGRFNSREELKKVPRMGEKAFQQSAGFLRIRNGSNLLDHTAVHPERYKLVEKMAKDCGSTIDQLVSEESTRNKIELTRYIGGDVGLPTLNDIMEELDRPGRDPRLQVKIFEFTPGIYHIDDLKPGMMVNGIVTNVTNFGAFVDIGIKQNGLIHISNIADEFVSNPHDHIKLHQQVVVKVIEVDASRNRIQLSLKQSDTGQQKI